MKKIFKAFILSLFIIISQCVPVFADNTYSYNYNYGINGVVESPAGYKYVRTIDSSYFPELELGSVDDICIADGKIYIADATNARINVLDLEDYSFVTSIKLIRNTEGKIVVDEKTGQQLMLQKPEGVFASEDFNEIYIADSTGERIVVLDDKTYTLKRVISRPDNMTGVTNFKPSKIAVDRAGRIYFIVQGSYEGIVELNPSGEFSRYYGVNKPKVSPVEYFWKSIASDEQKEKMAKSFAPSFSNLDIDKDGFVYATTFDSASQNMIFRFNAKGENVIREKGETRLIGDRTRFFVNSSKSSAFTDIAVKDFGTYAVVDKTYGRVFLYNFEGQLMSIFSKLGNMKGDLRSPSSLEFNGTDIFIGDSSLRAVHVYTPTDFGEALLTAEQYYSEGEWDKTAENLEQVIKYNANYYNAYSGIGRTYLLEQDYETAMYYFEIAEDTINYSEAFYGYRGEFIKEHFIWFALGFLLIVGSVIYSEILYAKKQD